MRKLASFIILSLLSLVMLLAPVLVVISTLLTTPVVAVGGSAWMKIVTHAWRGTSCGIHGGTDFYEGAVEINAPMCINQSVLGFADRFNITYWRAFVEVYGIKPDFSLLMLQGTFEPNATGFVKISWTVDPDWGLLILVKAKSYYSEKIGKGEPFKGIIIYALLIPPRNPTPEALEKMAKLTGLYSLGSASYREVLKKNFSINMNGVRTDYPGSFSFANSGPFDYLNGTGVNLRDFSEAFGRENQAKTPLNAWIAKAAIIFMIYQVHSWYDVKDNLSFAQIKIYDLDHTDPTSEASLIQAAVTGEDGQSRYTREIYPPEEGLKDGKFENNKLVPIPLQIFNINNKTVFHGGIAAGEEVGAPHLNATVRVWWETVIVNQTIYYGKIINGTLGAEQVDGLDKYAPTFVGPLNIWHNVTNPDEDYPVANFINATVFYAYFCAWDDDPKIKFPGAEDGDQLINARVVINLKDKNEEAYHETKNVLTTDSTGCTNTTHKYRGGLDYFGKRAYARFPNATMWSALYYEDPGDDDKIPEYFDERGIGSFWEKFGKHVWLNASLMYKPGDARNKDDTPDPTGSRLKDIANPIRIGDEDVLESTYYKGNWSMLVANVKYANTLTL